MYVNGLRKEVGQAMAAIPKGRLKPAPTNEIVGAGARHVGAGFSRPENDVVGAGFSRPECPKCGSDDDSMIEVVREGITTRTYFCNTCAHEWTVPLRPVGRFSSIEQVVHRTGLRRDELTTLADIGALNAFTNERRSALWQVERCVRPAGDLYAGDDNSQ